MKRQATERDKICAKHGSNNALVSKIFKEVLKLNNNQTNYPDSKQDKRFKQKPHQGRYTDGT